MSRFPDWQGRLSALLCARQTQPFAWGQQDCCLFVCDAVLVMTGHDAAAAERGYSTEKAAARLLKKLGGVRGIGATRFGAEIAPALAQVGDVGLVETGGRESLALCGGAHWLAPGQLGLTVLPSDAAIAAWRAC